MNNGLLIHLINFTRGLILGIVELVPGVSAGTLALILGIYEQSISAVSSIIDVIRALVTYPSRNWWVGVKKVWLLVPWKFLLVLVAGMVTAVLAFSHIIGIVIELMPGPSLAFFSGVIIVSIVMPIYEVRIWKVRHFVILLLSFLIVFIIFGLPVAGNNETPTLWFLAFSGLIGAAVMVLPGVSGSFVLLILGSYSHVIFLLRGLTGEDPEFLSVFVFLVFALIGAGGISKSMLWLLNRFKKITLVILTGLMLGSLRRLWPFLLDSDLNNGEALHRLPKISINRIGEISGKQFSEVLIAFLLGAIIASIGVLSFIKKKKAVSGVSQ